ncbi:MAG: metal ABC transporter permease [Dehalococcoidia bacterium]|jgi:ABC-type Mn2+/Zn2+ transport system permease subunit
MSEAWNWLSEPFQYAFMQRALLALAMVSVVSAVVGAFVVQKGLAFIGDALAHASFAGVAMAFVLGGSIYLGAVIAAVATALAIGFVSRRTRLSLDTSIGILFVGAFALGIVIISRQSNYTVDLFSFVFGNVLGVGRHDLLIIGVMAAGIILVVAAFYKELLFYAYDPDMAAASGVPVQAMHYGLLALIAIAAVVALKAVGIVLVVAMLVTPAATAALLVRRLPHMMAIGALVGLASSVIGLYVSYYASVASGASIVLVATFIFALAWLVSPRRGLLMLRHPATSFETEESAVAASPTDLA